LWLQDTEDGLLNLVVLQIAQGQLLPQRPLEVVEQTTFKRQSITVIQRGIDDIERHGLAAVDHAEVGTALPKFETGLNLDKRLLDVMPR